MPTKIVRFMLVMIAFASFATFASATSAMGTMAVERGDVVRLKDGGEVRGSIVKRDDRSVWIDVGPTVVSFDLDQVEEIQSQFATLLGREILRIVDELPETPARHKESPGLSRLLRLLRQHVRELCLAVAPP